ncbi:MAG: N-formylglutamate amidohydrolase [Bacteroidetes bacterium]|nr:N-formylglutamate amidohydrolase [Bacteroidota bacterium]MBS1540041.1 N-formylglutamate amidohydrolase [Bacteroidota bacterium]
MNYSFHLPQGNEVPILISVPHCGTEFPDELKDQYNPTLIAAPDDTDWFVHQLYDFAPAMGMAMIHATYSRWVIDLNRDPQSKPLYADGRIITALCPATTFLGEPLYRDQRKEVNQSEVDQRLVKYFYPYHQKIEEQLTRLKNKFGKVLLWDCHSIRQVVSTIQPEKFPDLILGDADGTAASPGLIETALGVLDHSPYSVSHNHPFKGGYITRHFGNPEKNVHALQLEMTKVNYLDDHETRYDHGRAEKMRELLKRVFGNLIEQLD